MAHDYKSLVWFPDNSAGKQCLIAFTIYNPLHSLCGCDHGLLYDLQKPVLTNGHFNLSDHNIWSRAFNPLCFSSFCLHQWVWALFSSLSLLQLTSNFPVPVCTQAPGLESSSSGVHCFHQTVISCTEQRGEWSGLHFLRFTNHTVQTAQLPSSVLERNPSHLSSPSQQLTCVSWGSFSIKTVSTSYCNSNLPPAQTYERTDLQYTGSRPSTHWVTSGIFRFISTFKGFCSL